MVQNPLTGASVFPFSCAKRSLFGLALSVSLAVFSSSLAAQDSRTVDEPKIPPVCARLSSQLSTVRGKLRQSDELISDTARLQSAIDLCLPGHAVRLESKGQKDAFLSGPLVLRRGVTLLLDGDVTLFASRNPRDFDLSPGSCGRLDDIGEGCKPFILSYQGAFSGIMGNGVVDGRGGEQLLGQNISWWDLARRAAKLNHKANRPDLISENESDEFTLYGVTIRNAPRDHVLISKGTGFTAWGVKIDSPPNAPGVNGIVLNSVNKSTITQSWIRAGADAISIRDSLIGPSTKITVSDDRLYQGKGIVITTGLGSGAVGGVNAVRVDSVSIDGARQGVRLASFSSTGNVKDVQYRRLCMRNTELPIVVQPSSPDGAAWSADYQEILFEDIHSMSRGKVVLQGKDTRHVLDVSLENVVVDDIQASDITASHAHVHVREGNLLLAGEDISLESEPDVSSHVPWPCDDTKFPLFTSAPQTTLTAAIEEDSRAVQGRRNVVVALDGSGDFSSVQQAVNELPSQGGTVVIHPGTYREVVTIRKPHVRLQGATQNPVDAVLVYGNVARSSGGTFNTATLFVEADDFYAENLTVANDYSLQVPTGQGGQAVALAVTGDRATFRHLRLLGAQDTLFANSNYCYSDTGPCKTTRQYFVDCYVEGNVDFIFGDSKAVFERCELHGTSHNVMLTAQSKRYPEEESGYVFDHCKVTADPQIVQISLGRPWRPYSKVIFLNTDLQAAILPTGWLEWPRYGKDSLPTTFYAEFGSYGIGANAKARNHYARQLTESQVRQYETKTFLAGDDGWDPTHVP